MIISNSFNGINKNTDFEDEIWKSFCSSLTLILNNHVKIKYPNVTTLSIEQGLFTSDEWGSYRVPCYGKDGEMLCYIICDVIMGEYKTYDGSY